MICVLCIYSIGTVTTDTILQENHRTCESTDNPASSNLLVRLLLCPLPPDGLLLRPHHLPLLERPLHHPLLVHLHSNGLLHGPRLPLGAGQALLLKPDERRGEVNPPGPGIGGVVLSSKGGLGVSVKAKDASIDKVEATRRRLLCSSSGDCNDLLNSGSSSLLRRVESLLLQQR